MKHTVEIANLRICSTANLREHWRVKARRASEEKLITAAALSRVPTKTLKAIQKAKKISLKLTRLAKRKLDRDNNIGGFKHVLDTICKWMGVDDGNEERLDIAWKQEIAPSYGVRIEIEW